MGKTKDLFKKIRDTKGTFHTKMGTTKNRNTEIEETLKVHETQPYPVFFSEARSLPGDSYSVFRAKLCVSC